MNRNKNQSSPLPSLDAMRRIGLTALFSCMLAVGANGQTTDTSGGLSDMPDLNRKARTHTWSIYAEGGTSWASGVWYQNVDAKKSYSLSPAVGGGIDYHIVPWVRVGAEYLYSRYRREQRFSTIDPKQMPVKTYGNYLMNYHKVRLGGDFNIMELWPSRGAQWLNIYVGTGVGYLFAKGNEYGMYINNTISQGGTTSPLTPDASFSNESSVTISGNMRTTNTHSDFKNFYIPASLHIEANVSPRVAFGLKGEMDWLIKREDMAPKNLIFALATVRYNFATSRAKALTEYYNSEISSLNERMNNLRQQAEADRQRADRAESMQQDLAKRLQDCEQSKPVVQQVSANAVQSHFVQFAHNSSYFDRTEAERLRNYAKSVNGCKLNLVAEASTPGDTEYNMQLSERRLQRVIDFLVKEGIDRDNLRPTIAVGEQNGKPNAEGRRVTITIEQNK